MLSFAFHTTEATFGTQKEIAMTRHYIDNAVRKYLGPEARHIEMTNLTPTPNSPPSVSPPDPLSPWLYKLSGL